MIYIDESTQSVNIPKTWAAVGNRPQEVTNYIALDLPDEEAQYPNLEEMLADIGIRCSGTPRQMGRTIIQSIFLYSTLGEF